MEQFCLSGLELHVPDKQVEEFVLAIARNVSHMIRVVLVSNDEMVIEHKVKLVAIILVKPHPLTIQGKADLIFTGFSVKFFKTNLQRTSTESISIVNPQYGVIVTSSETNCTCSVLVRVIVWPEPEKKPALAITLAAKIKTHNEARTACLMASPLGLWRIVVFGL